MTYDGRVVPSAIRKERGTQVAFVSAHSTFGRLLARTVRVHRRRVRRVRHQLDVRGVRLRFVVVLEVCVQGEEVTDGMQSWNRRWWCERRELCACRTQPDDERARTALRYDGVHGRVQLERVDVLYIPGLVGVGHGLFY